MCSSSRNWLQRQAKDIYVKRARADGYRARSAFKLLEINERFKPLITAGSAVAECGAAPGAWTQVAAAACNGQGAFSTEERHRPAGVVVGCDLLDVEPLKGAVLFPRCDFTHPDTQNLMLAALGGGGRKFDVVLSDMAPNASGTRALDHERIVQLSYRALRFAIVNSYPGGHFVTKIWSGGDADKLVKDAERFYRNVTYFKPKASRTESAELYVVAKVFKGLDGLTADATPP